MIKTLNIKKTVFTVIILNIIQISIISGFAVYEFLLNKRILLNPLFKDLNILLGIVLAIIFLNSFMMLRDAHLLNQVRLQDEMIQESLGRVEILNNTLRSQRHDFLNHLQVVYGLIELNEYQEAQTYLDRLYSDIQKVSRVLKTANPAVNALLQAKLLNCERRGITASLHITSQIKDLPVPPWEMCRILGNIIDNAFDALDEKQEARTLEIEIYEDLKCYGFRIKNNGSFIPEELLERIFEINFTTKSKRGEGLGLAIVKELVSNYNGKINITSNQEMTVFEVIIPKILSEPEN